MDSESALFRGYVTLGLKVRQLTRENDELHRTVRLLSGVLKRIREQQQLAELPSTQMDDEEEAPRKRCNVDECSCDIEVVLEEEEELQ